MPSWDSTQTKVIDCNKLQESEAYTLYNKALSLQRQDLHKAEDAFEQLLSHAFIREVSWHYLWTKKFIVILNISLCSRIYGLHVQNNQIYFLLPQFNVAINNVFSTFVFHMVNVSDVTIIDINRLSVAEAFRFSIIDSQISLSIVFDTDFM